MIYEGGNLLAETERFPDGPRHAVADIDLDRLRQDRMRQGTFDDNRRTQHADALFRTVHFRLDPMPEDAGPSFEGVLRGDSLVGRWDEGSIAGPRPAGRFAGVRR